MSFKPHTREYLRCKLVLKLKWIVTICDFLKPYPLLSVVGCTVLEHEYDNCYISRIIQPGTCQMKKNYREGGIWVISTKQTLYKHSRSGENCKPEAKNDVICQSEEILRRKYSSRCVVLCMQYMHNNA